VELKDEMYDVIIIGGGPAGLTAGIYAARARLKTLLIEAFSVPGQAVVTDKIENYPGFPDGIGGFELIEKLKNQAKKFGLEFAAGEVKKIERSARWRVVVEEAAQGSAYNSLSVIIATGAAPRKLNVPGEDKLKGKGVSYCAVCDGALFKDKSIVVVGGGDTAVEEALFLTKFGRKVTLIHRRDRLRATKILQERALSNKKIEFVWNSAAGEISGEQRVEAVRVRNNKTQEEKNLSCDGVFISIGYIPNTDFLKGAVKLDEKGYVIVDDSMRTSKEGIFACGDCREKLLRQVVTACGDGATAAFSAQQYVEELKGTAYK
jgi:thioredoxin reductase (NADPH)